MNVTRVSSNNRYQPFLVSDTQTLSANNTTAHTPIFGITGNVDVIGIWGVVTTALGSNITAAGFRLNDQTAQVDITAAAGTTLSSAAVGSQIARTTTAGTALTFINSSAGRVTDPNAATASDYLLGFGLTQKTGGVATNIEFSYTTTNTPTSGVIQFFCRYIPISAGASITPL